MVRIWCFDSSNHIGVRPLVPIIFTHMRHIYEYYLQVYKYNIYVWHILYKADIYIYIFIFTYIYTRVIHIVKNCLCLTYIYMPLCYFVPYPANHGFETAGRSDANNFTAKIVTLGSYRPAEPVRNQNKRRCCLVYSGCSTDLNVYGWSCTGLCTCKCMWIMYL